MEESVILPVAEHDTDDNQKLPKCAQSASDGNDWLALVVHWVRVYQGY
jgi:hypothetical protein